MTEIKSVSANPYYRPEDKVRYWQEKHNTEFERAKSYEMDLIHAQYEIRKLQAQISDLQFELESLKAMALQQSMVTNVLNGIGGSK